MRQESFDYVIVGAGSAGCVLAARLSEDPGVRVLLLEAGGSDFNPLIRIPLGLGKLHQYKLHDWAYLSEPEPHCDGRRIESPRGKVLGGSSSINMMTFTRGDAAGFDRWARNGATGWGYAEVLPFFKRLERAADGESATRGGAGPIGIQWTRTRDPICDAWIAACAAAGIAFNPDVSGGSPEGIGRSQFFIDRGRRASSSAAYLHRARARPNLTVRTRSLALRVAIERGRATGVDYRDRRGHAVTVAAAREVILCGGAYNSPHLLMLSGVGPADHLRSHGIAVQADLPVGRNLQDHLMVMNLYARKQPGEFQRNLRFDRMALHMLQAYFLRSGYATTLPSGVVAFLRSRPELDTPDLEFMFPMFPHNAGLWMPGFKRPYADAFGIRPALLRPRSRGAVTLRSADPAALPRIAFNFLSAPEDLAVLRHGLKRGRDIARHAALDPFRGAEMLPGETARTDAELDAYIRHTVLTVSHPAGTCAMGTGPEAVVDPALRVRGIERLRVVDASAMPDLISAHINACVLMMAEKASDLIRGPAHDPLP